MSRVKALVSREWRAFWRKEGGGPGPHHAAGPQAGRQYGAALELKQEELDQEGESS
jgi:hypothetical protein